MKRVIMILASVLLVAGLSVPTLGQTLTSSTNVTVTVFPAINDQIIDLAYTASYPGTPSDPGTPDPDDPWVLGTLVPPGARTNGGATNVYGYLWVYRFQSNAAMRCTVSHEEVDGYESLEALHNFLWQRKWTGGDLGGLFHPEPEDWVSDPLGPTYASEWTFPNEVKFDMANIPPAHSGTSPWSVAAGNYMSKVKTTWTVSGTDTPVLAAPYGYVKVTVGPALNDDINFAIGDSDGAPPRSGRFEALDVGSDWKGVVYPWVLNFQTNAPSFNRVTVGPITLGGADGAADIRAYMKHYAWTGSSYDEGHPMLPAGGGTYTYTGSAAATMTNMYSFPNKVEIDLSGETSGAQHRWMVQAGIYKPVSSALLTLEFGFNADMSNPVKTISVAQDNCRVIVPEAQDGYTLPESGQFDPWKVEPEQEATYTDTLTCYQNHDRDVWFTASGIDEAFLDWEFNHGENTQPGTPEVGEKWRGVFKYNEAGGASELTYKVTYTPDWTVVPGEKVLKITLNHTPGS